MLDAIDPANDYDLATLLRRIETLHAFTDAIRALKQLGFEGELSQLLGFDSRQELLSGFTEEHVRACECLKGPNGRVWLHILLARRSK